MLVSDQLIAIIDGYNASRSECLQKLETIIALDDL